MKTVEFTQYLKPYGTSGSIYIDLSDDIADIVAWVVDQGGRFTAEILSTGEVSFACEYRDLEEGVQDIAIEVVPNRPGVKETIEKMIEYSAHEIEKLQGGNKQKG